MSEPYLAEIRIVSFNFAPRGWAMCNGQNLLIAQNQALFSILGTTFGGDGQTTFALPDLRGRVPNHWGIGASLGERGGEVSHTVTAAEMPNHVHSLSASSGAPDQTVPGGNFLASFPGDTPYSPPASALSATAAATSFTGSGQAHENMQPYLVLNFVIAIQGLFPPRS